MCGFCCRVHTSLPCFSSMLNRGVYTLKVPLNLPFRFLDSQILSNIRLAHGSLHQDHKKIPWLPFLSRVESNEILWHMSIRVQQNYLWISTGLVLRLRDVKQCMPNIVHARPIRVGFNQDRDHGRGSLVD
ncbi:hypothetical protein VNO77_27862 [Canavalia gladiata]|uniref:Uncharacterized protein n=1 Tax=Canavalia gladiata TaxID=3824 RepID=A0AAN9KVG3_CANGL